MSELTLRESLELIESPPRVVGDDHVPTENELNNLMHLFLDRLGMGMRLVDFRAVLLVTSTALGGPVKSWKDMDVFIKEMAEYTWDHLAGEPDHVKVEDLVFLGGKIRDVLFSMDEATRNDIG